MAIEGVCRLCGQSGPLSKEHIPPKGGFKGREYRVEVQGAEAWLQRRRGRIYQRGHHVYSLCERCNNETGRLYGSEFARWSKWGLTLLDEMRKPEPGHVPVYTGYPARIAKQVISTMLAASQPGLGERNPQLREFVRNPDRRLDSLALRAYLCPTASGRSTGVAAKLDTKTGRHHVLVEFSLPPFGYIMTLAGEPLDDRPVDIAWFAACGYDEERAVELQRIPVLPTHLPLPEDYRSPDEIRLDVIQNILDEQSHPNSAEEAARIMASGEGPGFFTANGEDWSNVGAA